MKRLAKDNTVMAEVKAGARAGHAHVTSGKYLWVTEFNDQAMKEFYARFSDLEQDDTVPIITVVISSYGGEVDVLTAMRDLIKSSSKPVATVAMGKAMSCGAGLLAAGSKGLRFAAKNTSIMIHELSAMTFGKSEDIKATAADIVRANKILMQNLAADMGIPYKKLVAEIARRKNADWYLSATQAREWGLVDFVGVPRTVTQPEQAMLAIMPGTSGRPKKARKS